MPRSIDPQSFGFLVTDLARLIRGGFDRGIGEAGLGISAGEARTLVSVARAGSARQSALAERMGVEAMTLSGFLDRLEARGLIRRITDPGDRRAKLVETTAAADPVLAAIQRVGEAVRRDAAAGLSEEDWEAFLGGLKRAHDNLASARSAAARREAVTP